ncbi:hypothetical protein GGR55DRAFT_623109 [Xylaria sp. FL0064]|nr:hypothetical protein GGR55DRAFT_623109 [Xylaria sp. FL0064]
MSRRIQKRSRPHQREARVSRAEYVSQFGVEIFPCSSCESSGFSSCLRVDEFPSCHRCTLNQKPCDSVLMSTLSSITKERLRLREAKRKTQDELLALQKEMKTAMKDFENKMNERFSRLRRLETQEEFLHKQGVEILLREEELDRVEREEEERERAQSGGANGRPRPRPSRPGSVT